MKYQVMPELTAEEYSELKEDISRRGIMVPVEYDELGNVLDGYHRLKICGELGIKEFPKVIRAGMTEPEKLTHARKLNMARRQLTGDQKRELIRDQLKATPEQSDRQIAKTWGVSHVTVGTQRRELESIGQIDQSSRKTKDGRIYPAIRKPPTNLQDTTERENNSHNGQELRPCGTLKKAHKGGISKMPEVKKERTFWRDKELSLRHRNWAGIVRQWI